ncbi:DUF4097 family beta strand repeat-containing protein [Alicyclobacillus sp. SO9]|uniref:DUF4097 family beta strand repeat-containing protein n=1 Tax=Alicyclobacillus sp. SO9 TaxID=2665646 RepID=UPI0018E8031E|nr:DUF4097 family beta strand repeat-containing protein [Alicyclobacillus sp. SO9]QQE77393.1 DUF4097 family beta strand repeat protein [Alicyclobacillus sp. SO9]
MNDRKKILELVAQGKLTSEQAEMLLDALGKTKRNSSKTKDKFNRTWDVRSMSDLKQLGSQLSSTLSQSLADVRKTVENELKSFPSFGFASSLTAATEVNLPETIKDIWIETKNGQIQVHSWDEDYVKIHVRGHIRTDDLNTAEEKLKNALQTTQSEHRYHMTVLHDQKEGVLGASIEIQVPSGMLNTAVKSVNGEIRLDGLNTEQLRAETSNGNIWVHQVSANGLHFATDNGSIDIHQGLQSQTRNVYASTKNGTIVIEGIPSGLNPTGILKTAIGRIHVTDPNLHVEYIDQARKMHARLQSDEEGETPVHVHCESRNGSIYIRE